MTYITRRSLEAPQILVIHHHGKVLCERLSKDWVEQCQLPRRGIWHDEQSYVGGREPEIGVTPAEAIEALLQ